MSSNWRLLAISSAAKNRKKASFNLKKGENRIGNRKGSYIRINSLLCSRSHCTLFLEDDQILLEDYSRNGTYVNHENEIKQYQKDDGRVQLQNGDIICFGFNIGSVYNINDRNVFTYILKKEDIETIDLDDSDDDDGGVERTERAVTTTKQQDDDIFEIDSDSEHSGDECLANIDDIADDGSDNESSGHSSYGDDEADSMGGEDSSSSYDSGSFVVTKTILNAPTPPDNEIVELSDDESPDISSTQPIAEPTTSVGTESDPRPDSTSEQTKEKPEDDDEKEKEDEKEEEKEENKEQKNDKEEKQEEEKVAEAEKESTSKPNEEPESALMAQTENDETRLAKVRKRISEKVAKKLSITNPQPIKKRRRTFTEVEYKRKVERMDPHKIRQLRAERLAKLAADKKAEKEAADEGMDDVHRPAFVPRVHNTSVSRSAMLSTDMLVNDSSNS